MNEDKLAKAENIIRDKYNQLREKPADEKDALDYGIMRGLSYALQVINELQKENKDAKKV